ncbi:MAG TPA: inositol monophosphatase family protein [Solirubrobacteraceae bacterium]|nr:inositol monophosphatase family protein [Solirubrobacteraceae bacterium]
MAKITSAADADWLSACRRAVHGLKTMLSEHTTTAQRAVQTGDRGEGGDLTLEIDARAETIVFAELERLHGEGHRFSAISEERGEVDFGGGWTPDAVRVVIDPLDGSLNAKRGLTHYALALAVAVGPTMADVVFGYVYDFGPREEWWARRGSGAHLNGSLLDAAATEMRGHDGRLEVVGIEAADPRWMRRSLDRLVDRAYRLRAFGAMAPSLCQVAGARFDGLVSLRGCRAVDVAAAQLIVRESGGHVSFPDYQDRLGAPLDLVPHSPIVAARSEVGLSELEAVCRPR